MSVRTLTLLAAVLRRCVGVDFILFLPTVFVSKIHISMGSVLNLVSVSKLCTSFAGNHLDQLRRKALECSDNGVLHIFCCAVRHFYSNEKLIIMRDKLVCRWREAGRWEADTVVGVQGKSKACFGSFIEICLTLTMTH